MKLDIGCGSYKKEGYLGVDMLPPADFICNLDEQELPFEADTVDSIYSSHFLEHVKDPLKVLHKMVRVCKIGATVEIRVPHHFNPMAMCPGHIFVLSDKQFEHWLKEFIQISWAGSPKRLKLIKFEHNPTANFDELYRLLINWTHEQVLRLFPGACHELIVRAEVVTNEFYKPVE